MESALIYQAFFFFNPRKIVHAAVEWKVRDLQPVLFWFRHPWAALQVGHVKKKDSGRMLLSMFCLLLWDIFHKDIHFLPETLHCCDTAAYHTIKFRLKNSLLETKGWKKQMSAKDRHCCIEQERLQLDKEATHGLSWPPSTETSHWRRSDEWTRHKMDVRCGALNLKSPKRYWELQERKKGERLGLHKIVLEEDGTTWLFLNLDVFLGLVCPCMLSKVFTEVWASFGNFRQLSLGGLTFGNCCPDGISGCNNFIFYSAFSCCIHWLVYQNVCTLGLLPNNRLLEQWATCFKLRYEKQFTTIKKLHEDRSNPSDWTHKGTRSTFISLFQSIEALKVRNITWNWD